MLGNREILAKNLQYYMDAAGLSRYDICDALGIKYTTLTEWLKGRSYPRIDKLEMLANYFGIMKADLVEARNIEGRSKAVRIPVLGTVPAGLPLEAVEDIIDWEEIPEALARSGEYFALRVKGDSMRPRICDGDIIILRQQPSADSGDIVVATVNGCEATCKRLQVYADSLALMPLNPDYQPLVYSKKEVEELPVRILGKVVELRGKF